MLKKSILALLCLVFINTHSTFSQLTPYQPTIASPNASNLSVFGEIPVSHFTGTPDISVSCYELKTKSINIPITLRYHSAGIKPDQHPGWVGLGWNLSSGGSISRTIRQVADESWDPNVSPGYYYDHRLSAPGWERWALAEGLSSLDRYFRFTDITSTDTKADEFSFNFLGYSGKFYYDQSTRLFAVQSDQHFKVYLDPEAKLIDPFVRELYDENNVMSKSFNRFIIEDDKGNKFVFGGTNAIEYSERINPSIKAKDFFATTWNLVQIITTNKQDVIDFEYERGPYISQIYNYASYDSYYVDESCYNFYSGNWMVDGSFITPVYLKRIKVKNGQSVDFSISKSDDLKYKEIDYRKLFKVTKFDDYKLLTITNKIPFYDKELARNYIDRIVWLKLDSFKVRNQNGEILQNVGFSYNNISSERLFLEKVTFLPNKGTANKYNFHYVHKDRLPVYLENFTDHWGYNNGNRLTSTYSVNTIFSSRQPNALYGLYGILDTIYYPTGGKTAFEYESHQYSKVVNKDRTVLDKISGTAGGFRINKITSFSKDGNVLLSKSYKYVNGYANKNNESSGILNSMPKYHYGSFSIKDLSGRVFRLEIDSSTPVLPLNENSGIYIGYSEVTEIQSDKADQIGYTTFTYTNHDNGYNDSKAILESNREFAPYNDCNSRDFERGRLLKTAFYNSTGNLVKSIENSWERIFENESPSIHSLHFNVIPGKRLGCVTTDNLYPSSVAYLNFTYPFVLSQTSETSDGIVKITTNTYNINKQLISRSESSSRDLAKIVTYSYADKFANDLEGPNIYSKMVKQNMVGIPIETISYLMKSRQNVLLLDGQINTYGDGNLYDFILPAGILNLDRSKQVDSNDFLTETKGTKDGLSYDSRFVQKVKFHNYDSNSNLLSLSQPKGSKTNYIWGYSSQFPIAKIDNAEGVASTETLETKYVKLSLPEGKGSGNISFTKNTFGDIKIETEASPGFAYSVRYRLNGPVYKTGFLCISRNSQSCDDPASIIFNSLPVGTYSLDIDPKNGSLPINFFRDVTVSYKERKVLTNGNNDFFYEGFEENINSKVVTGKGHTGYKYWNGDYKPDFNPINGHNYIIQYWNYANSKWNFNQQVYSPGLTLTGLLDDIRIFPKDAQMTTFTYIPHVGMTSETSPSGHTIYYEYDDFQRLITTKDQSGNILKANSYHYTN